jgi:3'-phosphoadenosine 5'-phosphosulfate sulfotransferase (PAPS reductase)/FAD synthetase
MYAIISNYGNDAIALLQWAADAKLAPVYVIYVETNWHAPEWPARVAAGETYARSLDFQIVHLVPPLQFPDLITEKNSFPTPKFAWCAGILKGLPILEWLDTHDSPALKWLKQARIGVTDVSGSLYTNWMISIAMRC